MMNPAHRRYFIPKGFYWLLLVLFALSGCACEEKTRAKHNLCGEYIFRKSNEFFFTSPAPLPQERDAYPWETKYVGGLPRITKEFFTCKGNALNPVLIEERAGKEPLKHYDCSGAKNHGLPLRQGKEFIYPCLLELLNYVQEKSGKKVVITCGHRCPKHNKYADHTPYNWNSKHMLGAEVDFYVEGMTEYPLAVIALVQDYYLKNPPFSTDSEYTQFHRFDTKGLNVSTEPWYNKEIFIKLYKEQEGRDLDNTHPYPYISLQVRHDRDLNTKVTFEEKAAQNYLRH